MCLSAVLAAVPTVWTFDLGTYQLIYFDEFDALSAGQMAGNWKTTYPWGGRTNTSNSEAQWYVDKYYRGSDGTGPYLGLDPFSIEDGILTITGNPANDAVQSEIGGYAYTSGMLTSYGTFSFMYGYVEMRAKMPKGQGLWPAFWMLSAEGGWPPEIDIVEVLGDDPTSLHTTVHTTDGGTRTHYSKAISVEDMSADFHTYAVDWRENEITWYFDDVEVFRRVTPEDNKVPMYLLLNLAIGGAWGGYPDETTVFPAQYQIDYVRVYQEIAKPVEWARYAIGETGWVFTNDRFLHWLWVGAEGDHDWVYSHRLGAYLYLPPVQMGERGAWVYFPALDVLTTDTIEEPWLFSEALNTWLYAPNRQSANVSGWAFVWNAGEDAPGAA